MAFKNKLEKQQINTLDDLKGNQEKASRIIYVCKIYMIIEFNAEQERLEYHSDIVVSSSQGSVLKAFHTVDVSSLKGALF